MPGVKGGRVGLPFGTGLLPRRRGNTLFTCIVTLLALGALTGSTYSNLSSKCCELLKRGVTHSLPPPSLSTS